MTSSRFGALPQESSAAASTLWDHTVLALVPAALADTAVSDALSSLQLSHSAQTLLTPTHSSSYVQLLAHGPTHSPMVALSQHGATHHDAQQVQWSDYGPSFMSMPMPQVSTRCNALVIHQIVWMAKGNPLMLAKLIKSDRVNPARLMGHSADLPV